MTVTRSNKSKLGPLGHITLQPWHDKWSKNNISGACFFFFFVTHVELYHKFTQINDEQLVIVALQK